MGKLIDADEVIDIYKKLSNIPKVEKDMLYNILEDIPTAYDVENVVEQLQGVTHNMEICEEQYDMNTPYFIDVPYKMVKLTDAIEIVKAGGKE